MAALAGPILLILSLLIPAKFSISSETQQTTATTYIGSLIISALQLCQDEGGKEKLGEAEWVTRIQGHPRCAHSVAQGRWGASTLRGPLGHPCNGC